MILISRCVRQFALFLHQLLFTSPRLVTYKSGASWALSHPFFSPAFSHHVICSVAGMTADLPFSTSPCPSPRPLSARYFSSLVGTRLSIVFSVALSSFSLVYLPSTLSSVCVLHLSSSHERTSRSSVTFLASFITLVVLQMRSFPILSLRLRTSIIPFHLVPSISVFFLFFRCSPRFYPIAGLITVLLTFPFSFAGILLSHSWTLSHPF